MVNHDTIARVAEPDDVSQLRQRFPDWQFGTLWTAACSGPDHRSIIATKGPIILSAWDAGTLACEIEREEEGL